MADGIGSRFANAVAAAGDAARSRAGAVMQQGLDLAKKGAGSVVAGIGAILESDLASMAAVAGVALIPGVGTAASIIALGLKAGYDYALQGEKDYKSADPYLDKDLEQAAQVSCGGDVKKEKVRRREAREALVAAGKGSEDPAQRDAAARLERDLAGVERARLSKHVYEQYDPDHLPPRGPPTGFLIPTDEELAALGLEPEDLAPAGVDFRAQVYKVDPEVGPIPPDYITAFRGTVTRDDWTKANLPQGVGLETGSYNQAMSIAKTMARSGVASEFTGHSLGGGMASAAAVLTGLPATTQNSAGLHDATTLREGKPLDRGAAKAFVNDYRIDGAEKTEMLSSLNKLPLVPDAVGTPVSLEAPKEGVSRLGLHAVDAVIDSIEDQKKADEAALQVPAPGPVMRGLT